MKLKVFFIILKGFSLKQINIIIIFLTGESPTLKSLRSAIKLLLDTSYLEDVVLVASWF